MKKFALILFSLTFFCLAYASPAKPGGFELRQPDGSSFRATLRGDEWGNVLMLPDGSAIVKDPQGWYCYAGFHADGSRFPTTVHVGDKVPASVLSQSRNIPFDLISRRARTKSMENSMPGSAGINGLSRILVIPVQFQDVKFTYDLSLVDDLFNGKNYTYNGATGSVKQYFDDQLRTDASLEFVVAPLVTLSHRYSYYGHNTSAGFDERPSEAVVEACTAVNSSIDFGYFDNDDTAGVVDLVILMYAGGDEAQGNGDDRIWSHQSYVRGNAPALDGKKLGRYLMVSELYGNESYGFSFTRIGIACHEISHCFGLPDLYDTALGSFAMLGSIDLMDGGEYNNDARTPPAYSAVEWNLLGLGKEMLLEEGPCTLPVMSGESRAYYIQNGRKAGEFFLYEYRKSAGWDRYIGGSGLLVYHVDRSSDYAQRWNDNAVNAASEHRLVDLLTSDASVLPTTVDVASQKAFFPYGGVVSMNTTTHPRYAFWNGKSPDLMIADVKINSDALSFNATGTMTFTGKHIFQDAAIFQWNGAEGGQCILRLTGGPGMFETTVHAYEGNMYSVTLEGLAPNTAYTLTVTQDGGKKQTLEVEFTTLRYYLSGYPFIYLGDLTRNSDGTFAAGSRSALRVFNAREVAGVSWLLDGKQIQPDPDGLFPVRSGRLEAVVRYKDGRVEKIRKQLKVR